VAANAYDDSLGYLSMSRHRHEFAAVDIGPEVMVATVSL